MNIAYLRTSTAEQNLDRQYKIINDNNIKIDKYFTEKVSGKNVKDREELKKCMSYLREGDILYITEYSRFARNTIDLLQLVEEIYNKGASLKSIKEGFNIDVSTPEGRLILGIFASFSSWEREQILSRQKDGIAAARARGVYKGRKPKNPPELSNIFKELDEGKITVVAGARKLNMHRATLSKKYNQYKKENIK